MRGVTNWDWDGMKGEWLVLCVVCSVTEVGGFARGVAFAFAFLRLRFNSQIDQQVHTYSTSSQQLWSRYQSLHKVFVFSPPCIFPSTVLHIRVRKHLFNWNPFDCRALQGDDRCSLGASLSRFELLSSQRLVVLLDKCHTLQGKACPVCAIQR